MSPEPVGPHPKVVPGRAGALTNSPTVSPFNLSVMTMAFWLWYAAPAASPAVMPPMPPLPTPPVPVPPLEVAPLAMSPPAGLEVALTRFCCCSIAIFHDAMPGAACDDFQAQ